jgi:hypothetical protein
MAVRSGCRAPSTASGSSNPSICATGNQPKHRCGTGSPAIRRAPSALRSRKRATPSSGIARRGIFRTRRSESIAVSLLSSKSTSRGGRALTVDEVRRYRETWELAPISARKKLERLRTFFRFCIDNQWMHANPAGGIKSPFGCCGVRWASALGTPLPRPAPRALRPSGAVSRSPLRVSPGAPGGREAQRVPVG